MFYKNDYIIVSNINISNAIKTDMKLGIIITSGNIAFASIIRNMNFNSEIM